MKPHRLPLVTVEVAVGSDFEAYSFYQLNDGI